MDDLAPLQSHYTLEVQADGKLVSGLLVKMTLNSALVAKIKPHEKIDPEKVNDLCKIFSSGETQNMPITLGTSTQTVDCLLETKNIATIKEFNPLIIIDGHHRYEALKLLYESGIETIILAWITSIHELTISSFIKVCSYEDPQFLLHILKKYRINPNKNLYCAKGVYEINLFYLGEYYTIRFPTIELFLKEINIFENFLEQGSMNLLNVIDQDNHIDTYPQELNTTYLYFSHSSIEHAHLLTIIEKNKRLPRHSTCFKPKPNPLISYEKIIPFLIEIS